MKYILTVELTLDTKVSRNDVSEYVHDAIVCHGGALPPEDPFFAIECENVKVRAKNKPRKERAK